MGPYAKLARSIGDKTWFRPVATRILPPLDKQLARLGWRSTPWPTLLLVTVGRTSGCEHETPLYFVDDGGTLAVIATNYGRQEPDWSKNLRANPRTEVILRRATSRHTARLARPDEWQRIFAKFVHFYPGYITYREQAGRDIPIWILEGAR
jgi:deazaflavin-dependent oxidoreductase (nitroreductase family)